MLPTPPLVQRGIWSVYLTWTEIAVARNREAARLGLRSRHSPTRGQTGNLQCFSLNDVNALSRRPSGRQEDRSRLAISLGWGTAVVPAASCPAFEPVARVAPLRGARTDPLRSTDRSGARLVERVAPLRGARTDPLRSTDRSEARLVERVAPKGRQSSSATVHRPKRSKVGGA